MLTRYEARETLSRYQIPNGVDYHALHSNVVDRVIAAADRHKYRAPKNANGSRSRYFHAYLMRAARKSES